MTRAGALVSVAGGGDTVSALNAAEAATSFTFISTAGGAFLEWPPAHAKFVILLIESAGTLSIALCLLGLFAACASAPAPAVAAAGPEARP